MSRNYYTVDYNRGKAIEYANRWALDRNPKYMNLTGLGGDCTNFCSQCLYAGSGTMNYTPNMGWYYISTSNRAPAWTGVQFFYNFLTSNKGAGPFGHKCAIEELHPGDYVQLSFNGVEFRHCLLVLKIDGDPTPDNLYIAAHTNDAHMRKVSSYAYSDIRFLHIDGVRRFR